MGRIILLMLRVTDPEDEEKIKELTGWAERLLFSLRIINDLTKIKNSVEKADQDWWLILSLPIQGSGDDFVFIKEVLKEFRQMGPQAALQEVHLFIRLDVLSLLTGSRGQEKLAGVIGPRVALGLQVLGFNTNYMLVLSQDQLLPSYPFAVFGLNEEGFLKELLLDTLHRPGTKIWLVNCEGIHDPEDYCNFVLITNQDPETTLHQNGCPHGCGESENFQIIHEFTLRELSSWMEGDELLKTFVFQVGEGSYQEVDRRVILDIAHQLLKDRIPVRIEPDDEGPPEPDDKTPAPPSQDPLLDFKD